MCKPATMDDVRRVLRCLEMGQGVNEIARRTGLGRTAVGRIIHRAAIIGWREWIKKHMADRNYWDDPV